MEPRQAPRLVETLQAAPAPELPEGRSCRNCGEALVGKFCWSCGQGDVPLHPSLRQLASELLGEFFSFDSRLLRTLRPLLTRPGALTREYLAGRRIRFVSPLKTYLIAALIFFGLLALLPKTNVAVNRGFKPVAVPAGSHVSVGFALPEHYPFLDRELQAASVKAKANPKAFTDAVITNLPRLFFLLLPAFALLLSLFYRQGWHYLDHLVFALHYHAFVFLSLTALLVLARPWVPSVIAWVLGLLLWLGLLAYLPIAVRRVYGGSRPRTLLKLLGLGILYFMVFSACGFLVIAWTLWLF
jgi:hypothetical protein